jgi:photosynthetic reaction center H subunit
MLTGAITSHIDVAQVVLYAFWIFFAGLILYLRREDRREGYPLESDITGRPRTDSAWWMPSPKIWRLPGGGTSQAPRATVNEPRFNARRTSNVDGAPYEPTGNPLLEPFGPAAYALRDDVPDRTAHGDEKIVPMRVFAEMPVISGDLDPRGLNIVAGDGKVAGTVSDIWVDRGEVLVRYLEIRLPGSMDAAGALLVPMPMATVVTTSLFPSGHKTPHVRVSALRADQFASVPRTKSPDSVTRLEEDQITAYYAGGQFFNRYRPDIKS